MQSDIKTKTRKQAQFMHVVGSNLSKLNAWTDNNQLGASISQDIKKLEDTNKMVPKYLVNS